MSLATIGGLFEPPYVMCIRVATAMSGEHRHTKSNRARYLGMAQRIHHVPCMGKKFPSVSKEQISESFNKSEILINKTLDQNFTVITFDHENYPKKLQHIDDPPLILYANYFVDEYHNETKQNKLKAKLWIRFTGR